MAIRKAKIKPREWNPKHNTRKCHGCINRVNCNRLRYIISNKFLVETAELTPCRKCAHWRGFDQCVRCRFASDGICSFKKKSNKTD